MTMMMVTLVTLGLALRLWTAATRHDHPPALRPMAWICQGLAAWLVVAGVGGWSPIWLPVVLSLLAFLLSWRLPGRSLTVGMDLSTVALAGLASVPMLSLETMLSTAGIFALLGWCMDALLHHVRLHRLGVAMTVAGLLMSGTMICLVTARTATGPTHWAYNLAHFGIKAMNHGERVMLDTGHVAWLDRPPHRRVRSSGPAALLFHGNDPEGSQQKAAYSLRLALRHAGYTVLAVDHPGYGQSKLPADPDDPDAWNPLPTAKAAHKALLHSVAPEQIMLVGHSMGSLDAMRLLKTSPTRVDAVMLFGMGAIDMHEYENEMYPGFHESRGMNEHLPLDVWQQIHMRYYDTHVRINALPDDHPPIVNVMFGIEHADLRTTRDQVHAAIPGPAHAWTLDAVNHYFSVHSFAGLFAGNTAIGRTLARRMSALHHEMPAAQVIAP